MAVKKCCSVGHLANHLPGLYYALQKHKGWFNGKPFSALDNSSQLSVG